MFNGFHCFFGQLGKLLADESAVDMELIDVLFLTGFLRWRLSWQFIKREMDWLDFDLPKFLLHFLRKCKLLLRFLLDQINFCNLELVINDACRKNPFVHNLKILFEVIFEHRNGFEFNTWFLRCFFILIETINFKFTNVRICNLD